MKTCQYCGGELGSNVRKCSHCGEWLNQKDREKARQKPKNPFGMAAFLWAVIIGIPAMVFLGPVIGIILGVVVILIVAGIVQNMNAKAL